VSVAPAAAGTARRIGDILLQLGFASEGDLAKATAEQEKTGQPLGQILVDHGAITRLELASALAEQWSDQSASIKLLPAPPPAPRPAPQPHDEDQYAARLHDAVAELAQRVGANQPSEGFDERVTDLAERVEATVARAQRIEATLATLADSLEGVTGGVEEAFGALQTGMAGLALDLARIDTTVADLTVRTDGAPAPDPALATRFDELAAAVQELAERPVADDTVGGRVDELSSEIRALAERPVADDTIASRVDALEGHAASLPEIRATLQELASRPVGSPDLDARLARIETELAQPPAGTSGTAEVEKLATRLEKTVDKHKGLAAVVEELGLRLETVSRPDERVDHAAARLEELAAGLAAIREEVSLLTSSVTPATRVEELASRLDDLAAERVGHVSLAAKLAELERRLPSELVTPADLSQALAQAREEIVAGTRVEPDPRIEELAQALETVRAELAQTAGTATPDPELASRLDALADRVDQLASDGDIQRTLAAKLDELERRLPSDIVTLDDLSLSLARVREELVSTTGAAPADPRIEQLLDEVASLRVERTPDERFDALAGEVGAVRADLAEATGALGVAPAPDPELWNRLDTLAGRIEEVAGTGNVPAEVAARLDDFERRLPVEFVTPGDLALALDRARAEVVDVELPALDPRIDELAADLTALRSQLDGVVAAAVPGPVLPEEIGTLTERLGAVEGRLQGELVTSTDVSRAVDELRVELGAVEPPAPVDTGDLERSIALLAGRLEGLAARVDGLAEAAAATMPPSGPDPATEELYGRLEARLDELATRLEERLAAAPSGAAASSLDTEGLEELLERNRMTLERLGLHLGEHDRALAELMRSRNLPKRLDELAARVEELAGAAPSGGAVPGEGEGKGRGFDRSERALPGELAHEMKALLRRVEDAEIANSEDREKLMVRLERMASSIDWRLQRLEAGETE